MASFYCGRCYLFYFSGFGNRSFAPSWLGKARYFVVTITISGSPLLSAIISFWFLVSIVAAGAALLSLVGMGQRFHSGTRGGVLGASIFTVVLADTSAALLYCALYVFSCRPSSEVLRKLLLSAAVLAVFCVFVDHVLTDEITDPDVAFRGVTLLRLLRFTLQPTLPASSATASLIVKPKNEYPRSSLRLFPVDPMAVAPLNSL